MQYIKKKSHVDKNMMKPLKAKYSIIDLSRMMTYPRPAGSNMERKYIHKFIDTVPGMKKDPFGNRYIKIGKSNTMFSSHTDTVHTEPMIKYIPRRNIEKNIKYYDKQKIKNVNRNVLMGGKWLRSTGDDILGADDTTGNWLMLNMISEKKPGLYVFHREEELGRVGSEWIAKYRPKLVKGVKRAIAFDRKGYQDVITHQLGQRTASDKFAKELSRRLGGGYKPDPSGSFTDTASYTELIPECTNVSIGYKGAHTYEEKQNLRFAKHLYNRLREIDFETLPTVRKPMKQVKLYDNWDYNNYGTVSGYSQRSQYWDDRYDDDYYKYKKKTNTKQYKYKEEDKVDDEVSKGLKLLFYASERTDPKEVDEYIYKNMRKKKREGIIE